MSASGSITLPTIPRKSTVSCTDANINSTATININRASSGFTHTLTYNFGGLTGTIATKTSSTSIGWDIPTSFYAKIPNAIQGNGTITCRTYSGSTDLGTNNCDFTVYVNAAINTPNITIGAYDTDATVKALTGSSQKVIKGFSNIKVDMIAEPKNSATITENRVSLNTGEYANSTSATFNNTSGYIAYALARDSRGLTIDISKTLTVVPYVNLGHTIFTVERTSQLGTTAKLNIKVNYFNASFGAVNNTLTTKYRVKEKSSTTWGEYKSITLTKSGNTAQLLDYTLTETFDVDKSYDIEFYAQDKLRTIQPTFNLKSAQPVLDWGKDDVNINGNLKMSGYSTINGALNVGGKTSINSPLKCENDLLLICDTRNSNPTPDEIVGGLRGVKFDFKQSSINGVPTNEGYYNAQITIKKWGNSSGGKVNQLALTDANNMYIRTGVNSSWGNWNRFEKYDIGDVKITSTNTNPASKYGGTWVLIDKEFETYIGSLNFSENIANFEVSTIRVGHSVRIRIKISAKVTIGDGTQFFVKFGEGNMINYFGTTDLYYGKFNRTAFADAANVVICYNFTNSGEINTTDIVGADTAVNPIFYIDEEWILPPENMVDSKCNKFFWKKV